MLRERVVEHLGFLAPGLVEHRRQKLGSPLVFLGEDPLVLDACQVALRYQGLEDHLLGVRRPKGRLCSQVVARHARRVGALAGCLALAHLGAASFLADVLEEPDSPVEQLEQLGVLGHCGSVVGSLKTAWARTAAGKEEWKGELERARGLQFGISRMSQAKPAHFEDVSSETRARGIP